MEAKDIIKELRHDRPERNDLLKELCKELRSEHRTHQASVIRSLQFILSDYGMNSINPDLRNKDAVDFALEVAGIDKHISYI